MASNFNQVTLIGRLTSDPKIQYTAQKVSYVRATIAIDRPSYFANKQASVDFINVTIWNQNADYIGKYAKKGHLVFAVGELRNNNYLNPNTNQQVYRTEVSINRIDILTPASSGSSNSKSNNNANENRSFESSSKSKNTFEEPSNNINVDFGSIENDADDDYNGLDWDKPESI